MARHFCVKCFAKEGYLPDGRAAAIPVGRHSGDKEIAAKLAIFNHLPQITVGGGNDSDIHRDRSTPAETLNLPFLQYAQQFRLKF